MYAHLLLCLVCHILIILTGGRQEACRGSQRPFIVCLRFEAQLGDQEGLGGKIDDDDKKKNLGAVKETTEWIDRLG